MGTGAHIVAACQSKSEPDDAGRLDGTRQKLHQSANNSPFSPLLSNANPCSASRYPSSLGIEPVEPRAHVARLNCCFTDVPVGRNHNFTISPRRDSTHGSTRSAGACITPIRRVRSAYVRSRFFVSTVLVASLYLFWNKLDAKNSSGCPGGRQRARVRGFSDFSAASTTVLHCVS